LWVLTADEAVPAGSLADSASLFAAAIALACAVLTGFDASDVLSTLPSPTCALVTECGFDVFPVCELRFVCTAAAAPEASAPTSEYVYEGLFAAFAHSATSDAGMLAGLFLMYALLVVSVMDQSELTCPAAAWDALSAAAAAEEAAADALEDALEAFVDADAADAAAPD